MRLRLLSGLASIGAAAMVAAAAGPVGASERAPEGYPGSASTERLASRAARVSRPPFPVPRSAARRLRSIVVPTPNPPRGDRPGSYVQQTSCDPAEKPGITDFKSRVLARYPVTDDWGSSRNCADDGVSEHLEGRAWDWHADVRNRRQFRAAGHLLTWLTAPGPDGEAGYNARRLGIMYIIYNRRIWGSYRMAEGWRVLSTSNPHTDHVHFSFSWNGAMKRSSFWRGRARSEDFGPCRQYTGQPAPLYTAPNQDPCPRSRRLPADIPLQPTLWRGSSGPTVGALQQRLGVLPATSFFGAITQRKIAEYQRANGLPVTGAADALTRAHMQF